MEGGWRDWRESSVTFGSCCGTRVHSSIEIQQLIAHTAYKAGKMYPEGERGKTRLKFTLITKLEYFFGDVKNKLELSGLSNFKYMLVNKSINTTLTITYSHIHYVSANHKLGIENDSQGKLSSLGKFNRIHNAGELFKVSTKGSHYLHTFIIIWLFNS